MSNGCEPLTAAQVQIAASAPSEFIEEYREGLRSVIQREKGVTPTDSQIDALTERIRRSMEQHKASETIDAGIDSAVVVSAEECADYCATLPQGTDIADLVASVLPPFDSLFVEFQGRPNKFDCRSWGVLFIPDRRDDGWLVLAELVAEWDRRRPIGPLVRLLIPLDEQGMMRPGDAHGYGSIFVRPFEVPTVPEDAMRDFSDSFTSLLAPALFAISLMHCKNVDVREVEPPERMSRNHAKKHGRPLTKYYVLDIRAMRSVLNREGDAQASGLRHALHICRGHFKTYGEEAPLLGRHTGTYWWPAHVRGSAEEGQVEKDYRVRLEDGRAESFEEGLGREYVDADEHPEISPSAAEHTGREADTGERSSGRKTCNAGPDEEDSRVGHSPRRLPVRPPAGCCGSRGTGCRGRTRP